MGTTPMFAPDGTIGDVPHAKIGDAVKAGFKIGVDMNAPNGSKGTIPVERIHDAIKAGFSPFIPTEAQAAQNPIVAPVPLPGAGQKIMGGTFPSELDPSKKYDEPMGQPVFPVAGLSIPQVAGGIAGSIGGGKLGEYIGEKSKLSSYETMWAGRIGSTLGGFAGAGGGAQAEEIWSGLKSKLADKIYTPTGKLTPEGEALVHPTKLTETILRKIIPGPSQEPTSVPISQSPYFNKILAARGIARAEARGTAKTAAAESAPPEELQGGIPNKVVLAGTPEANAPPIKGSFWSYDQDALRKQVLTGDHDAAVVWRMRFGDLPKGAKYMTDAAESIIKGLYQSSKD